MTELDVARAIAAGTMPSPTRFLNAALYALRFTGTGVAWRDAAKEFCYRPSGVWLTPEMADRVRGVPIIFMHPPKGILDGNEFVKRVVGSVIFGWPRGDELWCVGRILDQDAAAVLDGDEFDTSPAVTFGTVDNTVIEIEGDKLLVEGEPQLLDHLALCPRGVWSRNGAPDGVEINSAEELVQ